MGEIKVVNYPNHVTSIVYGDCLAFIRLEGIQNQCDFVKISIGIGPCLKVSDVIGVVPLLKFHVPYLFKLQSNVLRRVACKITASFFGTVYTASHTLCAVTIWTATAHIKAYLKNLFAETMSQIVIEGVVSFVVVRIFKGRVQIRFPFAFIRQKTFLSVF